MTSESDLLAALLSSKLFNVQNVNGLPSLAANVVPSCVVPRGVVRHCAEGFPQINVSGSAAAALDCNARFKERISHATTMQEARGR